MFSRFFLLRFTVAAVTALVLGSQAQAHFQFLIPSEDVITATGSRSVTLDLLFGHPMAGGPAMEMKKPVRFGVKAGDKVDDLMSSLKRKSVDGKTAWEATYSFKTPGSHTFFVEPQPYWERAEGMMIVHYAKVTVDAFESGENWEDTVGLPVEIKPLTRPYGLWTGNVFRGVVLKDGAPVPDATVEIEWKNDGSVKIPSAAFETQVVKTDSQGVFVYAMPRAGWWGFAALVQGDAPMKSPEGKDVPVELGGLIWVHARDMK